MRDFVNRGSQPVLPSSPAGRGRRREWLRWLAPALGLVVLLAGRFALPRAASPAATGGPSGIRPGRRLMAGRPARDEEAMMRRFEALLGQPAPFADPATITALEQLAANPAQCVALGRRLMAEYPRCAVDGGTILIGALVRADAHAEAVALADAGPAAERDNWYATIYGHWIMHGAEDRTTMAARVREVAPGAFSTVVRNWASVAPEEVARYSQQLPWGEDRQMVLSASLNEWALRDPVAVLGWIHLLPDDAEFDYALSHVVLRTDALVLPARQAVEFAASIQDVQLRAIVLRHAVDVWRRENPSERFRADAGAGDIDRSVPPQSPDS